MKTIDELRAKFVELQGVPEAADRLEGLKAIYLHLCNIESRAMVWGAVPLLTLKEARAFMPDVSAAVNRTRAIVNRQQARASR